MSLCWSQRELEAHRAGRGRLDQGVDASDLTRLGLRPGRLGPLAGPRGLVSAWNALPGTTTPEPLNRADKPQVRGGNNRRYQTAARRLADRNRKRRSRAR